MRMNRFLYLFLVLLFSPVAFGASHPEVHMTMDQAAVQKTGRNEKTEGVAAQLEMSGQPKVEITLSTRGQSSIKAPRKNYDFEINQCRGANSKTHFRIWKKKSCALSLTSMWEDSAYVSTLMGFEFMRAFGVFELNVMYIELFLNGKSRGLYLLSETPREVIKEDLHADWIALRKGSIQGDKDLATFANDMEHFDDASQLIVNWNDPRHPCVNCPKDYSHVNELLLENMKPDPKTKGKALYNQLKQIFDMKQMFTFMGVNRLLRNGDFADEFMIYHTGKKKPLRIFGWDYDDLFKGIHWASKNSLKEKYDDPLVYNYETALFVLTAKDPVLRAEYHSQVKLLTKIANDQFIDHVVDRVKTAISPFLDIPAIYENSNLDNPDTTGGHAYTKNIILKTLEDRRREIKGERDLLIQLLKKG